MTKKTISELNDILLTQESTAVVAIEQNGSTFKAPVRPNPPFQFNVSSQAQLEAAFGTNLVIPSSISVIVIDKAFVLNKPFKLDLDANLEIFASAPSIILDYDGTGPMFQNLDPLVRSGRLLIHDIRIFALNPGKTLFDVFLCPVVSLFSLARVEIFDFESLGTVDTPALSMQTIFVSDPEVGLIIKNAGIVQISNTAMRQDTPGNNLTFISFFASQSIKVIIDNLTSQGVGAGDALLFLDPNSPVGSTYNISNSTVDGGDFYKTDAIQSIITVFGDGSGNARFTTSTPHGFVDGQLVVHSGFTVSPEFNGTHVIKLFNADMYDVIGLVPLNQTGFVDVISLDQTDNRVTASSNPNQPDSMFLAEGRSVGTLLVDSILNTLVPIVDTTPVSGDFIQDVGTERFAVDDTTGIITYTGLEPITVLISYELNAEKASGADQNLVISLEINGTPQTKSDINLLAPATPGLFGTSGRKIYTIVNGDTFQLFLNNTTNSTDTNVTKLALVISRQ